MEKDCNEQTIICYGPIQPLIYTAVLDAQFRFFAYVLPCLHLLLKAQPISNTCVYTCLTVENDSKQPTGTAMDTSKIQAIAWELGHFCQAVET